jgi:hypothetical protein
MTSIIKVDNIQTSGGTAALEIDSSGRMITKVPVHVSVDFGGPNAYASINANDTFGFDNVWNGTASYYDTSTYKFTCPVDGVYLMHFNGLVNADKTWGAYPYRNSTRLGLMYTTGRGLQGDICVQCDSGDELYFTAINDDSDIYQGTDNNRYSWASYSLIG